MTARSQRSGPKKPQGNPWPKGRPSEITTADWIDVYAEISPPLTSRRAARIKHELPPPSPAPIEDGVPRVRGGKWLLFVDRANIDEVWEKIADAVRAGRLGNSAKVSTARPNPRSRQPGKHVICVYTSDDEDYEDVMRVRQELRRLGFVAPIAYKTDQTTVEGRYAGSGPVAKYFE